MTITINFVNVSILNLKYFGKSLHGIVEVVNHVSDHVIAFLEVGCSVQAGEDLEAL